MPLSANHATRSRRMSTVRRVAEGHGRHVRVLAVGARDDREEQGQVLDPAGDRSQLRQRLEDASVRRGVPGPRHAAARRLEARHAAVVRRLPDAVAGVAPDVERRAAGGDDGRRAAAAPAGRTRQVIRVRCPTIDEVVGLVRPRELRRVRLPEQDAAGRPQSSHHRRVPVGHALRPADRARGRHETGRVERVLDRERDAVQRPEERAGHEVGVGLACRLEGSVREPHDGVDQRVDGIDPTQAGVDDLYGGQPAVTDRRGDSRGRREGQLGIRHRCPY